MPRFKFIDRIPAVLRNKYILTLVVFITWVMLLDSNNLISRFRDMRELKHLRKEKEYYLNKIKEDSEKVEELRTDNENLEKFAREQFRMKKPDEDLFIVVSPGEDRKIRESE